MRSLRSRVGTNDGGRACGAGAAFGHTWPLALLAAMTHCILAAWTESRRAGAAGASGFDRGFVACIVAWARPPCAVGAFADAVSFHAMQD
jgi:hypothetical protein